MDTRIAEDVFWVGVEDRTTDLFEGLWPVAESGVTYNAYLIRDEKTVLVDLSRASKAEEFLDQLGPIEKLDYVVVNHMEPDHTGALKILRSLFPKLEIVCAPKAVAMLRDYYGIETGIRTVADGESLSIGKRELRFFHVPFVHWPETMVTYDPLTKTLFSCDAFGGYGAHRGLLYDDEQADLAFYESEALRYYANIVAKFSTPVLNAIKKLAGVEIKAVAPSHGLIWRRDPQRIVELYKKWAGYAASGGEPGVTLLYGSMYGNTEAMMNAVAEGVRSQGVPLQIFDVARVHPSYILPAVMQSRGVAIGAPTYEAMLFPYMQTVLDEIALKLMKNKTAVYFGSYGWSKGAWKKVQALTEPLSWSFLDSFEFAGGADEKKREAGRALGASLATAVKGA